MISGRERAVSEILGYVIIFALVVAVIGFVTAVGMPALIDTQQSEQAASAERAFDVVGENLAAIYERGAPSRATEIDLTDTELFYGTPVTMNVTVDGNSTVTDLRPVVLRVDDDTSLVYEGGAVFRDEGDGGLVLREPPLLLDQSRIFLPVIETTAPAIEAAGGTTVLFRGESKRRSVLHAATSGDVTITVESPRYELWERYFVDQPGLTASDCTVDDSNDSVTCQATADTISVTLQEIGVEILV
ncbi:DUF7289 family protein [Halovenus salina]|uniref:Flagellin n=1 Tax=Halovenus salina TaxID=1510225 RepID=A0ABD5W1N7_9EURY|nr:hypothetical protein [Halovenus salina]